MRLERGRAEDRRRSYASREEQVRVSGGTPETTGGTPVPPDAGVEQSLRPVPSGVAPEGIWNESVRGNKSVRVEAAWGQVRESGETLNSLVADDSDLSCTI